MAVLRKFNFRSAPDSKLAESPDAVPTLSPQEAVDLFKGEDKNPYFKLEAIEYPTPANGWIYTEEFWKSYVGKLNTAPIPGSARGHETRWGARGYTDFIVIGGRMDSKGDGTGTVYLKTYVPPKGESGDNAVFIASCKAGMVDFSIVSYTRDLIEQQPDGNYTRKCVESMFGERNDAVDLGAGAMDLKTNANGQRLNKKCLTFAKSLISSGKVDSSSAWKMTSSDEDTMLGADEDWEEYAKWHLVEDQSSSEDTKARWKYPVGKSGKVYRSALRAIASRASANGLEDVSNTASDLIKEIDKKKGSHMDKVETLSALGALKRNSEVTLDEVADAMGQKSMVKSVQDEADLAKFNSIKSLIGEGDPEILVKGFMDTAKANAEAARAKMLTDEFGVKSSKVGEVEVVNPAYQYADKSTVGLSGEKLNAAVVALKDDIVMKGLRANMADQDSPFNVIVEGDKPKVNASDKFVGSAVSL